MSDVSELERKRKTELFKKHILGERAEAETAEEKAATFARLVAGKTPKKSKPVEIQKNPFDEMKDFMRDPFGSKDWAKSKELKKAPVSESQDMIEMVIAEPSEEELQKFWASRSDEDDDI